jgi:hypothetical protein
MPARLTQPFDPIREIGVTELVGADEQVDQNEYGGSVAISLGVQISGEFLHFTLYSRETGTGAIQTPAGSLFILDADPANAAGAAAITAAARLTVIAEVPVAAADWPADAAGASVTVTDKPVAFHALQTIYFLWFHEDATSLNDGAGDDEILEVNAWYRRDS